MCVERGPNNTGALVETDFQEQHTLHGSPRHMGASRRRSYMVPWSREFSPGQKLPFPSPFARRWSISASEARRSPQNASLWYPVQIRDRVTGRSQKLGDWQLGVSPDIQWIGDLTEMDALNMFVFGRQSRDRICFLDSVLVEPGEGHHALREGGKVLHTRLLVTGMPRLEAPEFWYYSPVRRVPHSSDTKGEVLWPSIP